MIDLKNVCKYYNEVAAVENLSFHVRKGEIFGLIGTSGCGKTTTLKMMNRLIEPTSGSIVIDGKAVSGEDPEKLRRKIGYVIQNVGLFPHYSVEENIAVVPKLQRWEEECIRSRSRELLDLVGLEADVFARRKPNSLSGGQQQRVGLARALAADPPIILMDEPFGALDPITKQQVRREVSRLFKKIRKTIVLVTHDVVEAFAMCDRLCLLDNGKVQQIGTPQELLFQPANSFVESFLGSNRFQLELLSVTIGEIFEDGAQPVEFFWRGRGSSENAGAEIERRLSPGTSLYELIEQLEQVESGRVGIVDPKSGKVRASAGFLDLLSAFRRFKGKLKSGR